MRNYSLSNKPGQDYFRISVKRESSGQAGVPDGYVSTKLHREFDVGSTLEIGAPCGEFYLNAEATHDRPLVLLAAGVGVTPILSMLKTAVSSTPNRRIVYVHGSLNEHVQAFKSTVDALAAEYPNLTVHYRYDEITGTDVASGDNCSTGFVDAQLIESLVPEKDADYYFCGPKPFMVNVYRDLRRWNIPEAQVHYEFFGPRQELDGAA